MRRLFRAHSTHPRRAAAPRVLGVALLPALVATTTLSAAADAPAVVTSIKPVQSLVAAVMQGIGTPILLIDGAASPHGFALKPSQAGQLQDADVVFWIGEHLTPSLEKPLHTMAEKATVVSLMDAPGVTVLPFRDGDGFAPHEHGHDDDHGDHEAHDDHGATADTAHDDHGHSGGGLDPHIWMDPENARAMAREIASRLSATDPDNADRYRENAAALDTRLEALTTELSARLEPVANQPFVVFHDAYHYFEDRFGLQSAGTITFNPEIAPGAEQLSEIQNTIRDRGVKCVFAEPQFEPKLVSVALEGSGARMATLDPLGANLAAGPELYFNLLAQTADAFTSCLFAPAK